MFSLSLALIFGSVIYLSLSRNNKANCIFSLIFFDMAVLVASSALYASKLASYAYANDIDYKIYSLLSGTSFSFYDISNFYILCMSLLMGAFLLFYRLFSRRMPWVVFCIVFMPVILFFVLNNSYATWEIYRLSNTECALKNAALAISAVLPVLNNAVLIYAMTMPLIALVINYKRTGLIFKKRFYLCLIIAMVIIDFSVYAIIFLMFGGFMSFFNRDLMGFPKSITSLDSYFMCLVLLMLLFTVMVFTVLKKPFSNKYAFKSLRRRRERVLIVKNFSMILHKYKNAFSTILHIAELLQGAFDSGDKESFEECTEMLDKISRAQIADLTKMSRSCGGINLSMEEEDILKILRDAVSAARRETVRIDLNSSAITTAVLGDGEHLKEVFLNIITNAVTAVIKKHSKSGNGRIEINVLNEDEYVVVKIRDNGCGILQKDIKNIFKPFYTTGKPDANSGMGLKIADDIIALHDGYIYVSSEPGEYTEFAVIMPIFM